MNSMRWAVSFVAFVVLAAPVFASGPAAEPDQPKGIGRTPSRNVGVDVAAIESVYAEIANDPHRDLEGVVIRRDGRLVSERYFNGDDASTMHDIRSATKSITALLMGIAIQCGLIHR